MAFTTATCTVDINKLMANIKKVKDHIYQKTHTRPKLLLPVKANAYGHGMLEISKYSEKLHLCDYLGVAHLCEAYELRQHGVNLPIIVLGQISENDNGIEFAVQNDIELAVSNIDLLRKINETSAKFDMQTNVHLDIDTGMGRTGFLYTELPSAVETIQSLTNINVSGLMTHFAVSDSLDKECLEFTKLQYERFIATRDLVKTTFPRSKIVTHASNSGGVITSVGTELDMIRPGIALYGYPDPKQDLQLQPVMEVRSSITLLKKYPAGYSIGYGRTYTTQQPERLGVVPLGYGDGIFRCLGNKLTPLVNGKKSIATGRVSMDQFTMKVFEETKCGDEVIIIGKQGSEVNTAADIAKQADTITYEVLCAIGNSPRVEHRYVNGILE